MLVEKLRTAKEEKVRSEEEKREEYTEKERQRRVARGLVVDVRLTDEPQTHGGQDEIRYRLEGITLEKSWAVGGGANLLVDSSYANCHQQETLEMVQNANYNVSPPHTAQPSLFEMLCSTQDTLCWTIGLNRTFETSPLPN